MRSGDPVCSAVMPVVVNGPHGAINYQGSATKSVIILPFAMCQQPDIHGLPKWGGGAQTIGPDFMHRGADAVMVLCIQGIGSLII